MAGDPYAQHLERARVLFANGEVLQAGQIWQAILKKQSDHAEARAGLLQVKRWMDTRKPRESAAPPPAAAAPELAAELPAPELLPPELLTPAPAAPSPVPARVHNPTVPFKPFKAAEPDLETGEPEAGVDSEDEAIPLPNSLDSDEQEPAERLLKEGCTLYDMDQIEDALQKWEQILTQDPHHALALAYIAQARQELGFEPFEIPVATPPTSAPKPPVPAIEPEEMLRRASQLYEMGSLEESIASLERILAVDPGNADAQRFILLARRELAESTPPVHQSPPPAIYAPPAYVPPAPPAYIPPASPSIPNYAAPTSHQAIPTLFTPPSPEPPPSTRTGDPPTLGRNSGFIAQPGRSTTDSIEQKLSQGERLLLLGRMEEAGFAFQMALSAAPNDPRALDGLQRAKGPDQTNLPASEKTLTGVPGEAPKPVQPPASLTAPASVSRQGPELPRSLQDLSQHPVLGSTRVLVGGAALVVVLGVGLQFFQKHRKDEQLRAAVAHARANAIAPVSQISLTVDLNESAPALRQEADATLAYDPIRSYHRAKELLRRDATDAVGAALLEKARAALLADPVPGVSLTEFQRLLNAGDLEGAERAIDALLRARPDDPDLMQREARLERVLAGLHASKGEWNEAKTALQKGRALFPQDKSWQARIHFLDRIQGKSKAELAGWLPFLG